MPRSRRPSLTRVLAGAVTAILALALATPATARVASASRAPAAAALPHYDHIFTVVEENHGFADVIGNPAAPNLNALAKRFGLATASYGVAHPSEPHYVGLLGGNFFGVADDNPYYLNSIDQPSLISQLDHAGIGWKAYLQGLPHPGYQGICYPAKCNGSPDIDPLYVSKHDGIQNFATARNPRDWSRQVPIEQLARDLARSDVPAFGYVIPDECHDMHGDPPYCLDSGNPGDPQDQRLVTIGDRYLGQLVSQITSASFWAKGNNAIVLTFDEADDDAGCCDASPGGGRVATIVVTSHGPRGLTDPTPYNHYSLLQTIQRSFGLGCLQFTCDSLNVKPLTPLFAVRRTPAISTKPLPVPDSPTPTPTPAEPSSSTSNTPSAGGWTAVSSPLLGTNDNSLGAVAAAASNDVWAVGNFLPDIPASNQDATLTLADHYDGTRWSAVPTPNAGPNFNTLFGVAARDGRAWAVGVRQDADYNDRGLIEAWDGARWTIVDAPQPGSSRDLLFGVSALSASDVWAVGDQQGSNGRFKTLVEHWDGHGWSVVPSPGHGSASALLEGIAAGDGQVWAVGETDDAALGARPLIERYHDGAWTTVDLPAAGSGFTSLFGVAVSHDGVWAVGTFLDLGSGNEQTLILHGAHGSWSVVNGPNPGSEDNILGAVAATGDTVWAVGHDKNGGSRQTLIERHHER